MGLDLSRSAPEAGVGVLLWLHLDCSDPGRLAAFYHQLLGWAIIEEHDDYAVISGGGTSICFTRAEGYAAPGWPDTSSPKRYHFDVTVADRPAAIARCLALGAAQPDVQPGGDRWTVLTDPEGHPFCLCA